MTNQAMAVARYRAPVKAFHWIVALLVFVAFPVGFFLDKLAPGPFQNAMYDLHRSLGTLILAVVALRLVTRLALGAPPHEPGLSRLQVIAAAAAHWALYVLLFAVPILGWAATSAFGAPISVFGLFVLPPILGKDRELAETLFFAHRNAALAMAAIFAVHLLAALYHHVVRRDGVLYRML